jgi:hypothetical protein
VSPLKIKIPSKKIRAGSVARKDLIPTLKGESIYADKAELSVNTYNLS